MSGPRFQQTDAVDEAGIVGARWWQDSLSLEDPVARREALKKLLLVGAGVAGVGVVIAIAKSASAPDTKREPRDALGLQREHGWSFGAGDEPLTFDGAQYAAFDRASLKRLPAELSPAQPRLAAHFVPTLFQAPEAVPRQVLDGEVITPLRDALVPVFTPPMAEAYKRGLALASLFDADAPDDVMLVLDLPGPEAVAMAAGVSARFDTVFAFDNWPHPRGVVPAHKTLAACVYYQPLFAKRQARSARLPFAIVLDRARLSPYTDDVAQFDNRHVAKIPSAAALATLGVKRVLYVVPRDVDVPELDDLNADFVELAQRGIAVKAFAATDLALGAPADPPREPSDSGFAYWYGGSPQTHGWFWTTYPWRTPRPAATQPPALSSIGTYAPYPRHTLFSLAGGAKQRPAGFGVVPVIVALGTGLVVGAAFGRSGSMGRGWGGGGLSEMAIRYSVFALELASSMRNERLFQRLRAIVARQPAAQSFAEKRELYLDISQTLLAELPVFGRGCWDYFLDADVAEAKYAEWCQGVTEHEGVRQGPMRGVGGPYRASGEEGFFAFTVAMLVTRGSNTDATLQERCDEAQGRLWGRGTFCDFIQALPELNFASVRSDVVYLIPGNDTWALTEADLAGPKFAYLRRIED